MNKSYSIKGKPEDFIVEEVHTVHLQDGGAYAYVNVRKEGMNTEDVKMALSKAFNISPKDIAYSGLKDKQATTTQVISLRGVSKERIERFTHEKIRLWFLGFGDEPVFIGSHQANKFTIRVHILNLGARIAYDQRNKIISQNPFLINYFDEQRFSTQNIEVGLAILQKDFKTACKLIEKEEPEISQFRECLENHPTDHIGALNKIPKDILRMYVHSVQSVIFNNILSRFIREECIVRKTNFADVQYSQGTLAFPEDARMLNGMNVPLVGFGMERYPIFEDFIKEEMKKFKINERDFIMRSLPQISCEGTVREAAVPISNFQAREESETSIVVSFVLPKGSYATMVLKQLFLE